MERFPKASAAVFAGLAGLALVTWAPGGLLAGAAFLVTVAALAAGAPVALVWAWPAGVAAALGCCVWGAIELGPGAIWLGAAAGATVLAFYVASPAMVPLAAGALLAHLAWPYGMPAALAAFAAGVTALTLVGRRVTQPLVFAGWVVASSAIGSRVALAAADDAASWTGRALAGPWPVVPWTAAAAIVAALLVWPHPRKG